MDLNQQIINDHNRSDLVDPITKINHQLYLGQGRATAYADGLSKMGITHIVSVGRTPHQAVISGPFTRLEISNLLDRDHENLSIHFPTIFEFIRNAFKNQGRVLIHCEMGVSRAPTVMIAFLRANGCFNSLQAAYDYVKQVRPWINPNGGFKNQLQMFFSEQLK